jgi:hypothetical protein
MRSSSRFGTVVRTVLVVLVALAITTPASAQFGGLKKRLKGKAAEEGVSKAAGNAGDAPAENADAGSTGGTVVLSPEVVSQMLNGLKAGQAEREAAEKEDTPYGRYRKAQAAYTAAEAKCAAAHQAFPERAAGDQKMLDKYSALIQKMSDAQAKQDYKLMQIYQDSAMAMMDPSCVVKKPEQPKDFYEAQRDIDVRAERAEVQASGLSSGELSMAKERTFAILQDAAPPGGASADEKSAVAARAAELKPLFGLEPPPARATKTAAAPAPPAPIAAASQTDSQIPPETAKLSACMTKNAREHQAEFEALGKRAQAAQAANDTEKLMAIADTLQQIQTAGCR